MTYAIAIRRVESNDYQNPVIIIKQGLSFLYARDTAERLNRESMAECRALGGECFVAYNTQAI